MKTTHGFLFNLPWLAQPVRLNAQASRTLDSLFHTLDTAHIFNGNVLIREKGMTTYQYSAGSAELEHL